MARAASLLRPALTLLVLAGLGAAALRGLEQLTAPRVAEHAARARAERVLGLLEGLAYDNAPQEDAIEVRGGHPGVRYHRVFRARRDGQAVAAVLELTSTEGYAGPVRMLLAVAADGSVLGVSFLAHRETPGLGDRIEPGRSSWLRRLEGRSLGDPPASAWTLARAGGAFDALTGATVTSRAVLRAVARGLAFHARYAATIHELPAGGVLERAARAGEVER